MCMSCIIPKDMSAGVGLALSCPSPDAPHLHTYSQPADSLHVGQQTLPTTLVLTESMFMSCFIPNDMSAGVGLALSCPSPDAPHLHTYSQPADLPHVGQQTLPTTLVLTESMFGEG